MWGFHSVPLICPVPSLTSCYLDNRTASGKPARLFSPAWFEDTTHWLLLMLCEMFVLGDYCSLMEVTEFPPMWIAINSLFCIFRKFSFLLVGVVCKSNTSAVVNNVTLGYPDTRNELFDSGAAENCEQWNRVTVKPVGLSSLSFYRGKNLPEHQFQLLGDLINRQLGLFILQ